MRSRRNNSTKRKEINGDRLTGQRKEKGMTSLALALFGSIKVNELPAKIGLDELPYVHGLETVTFL